MAVIFRFRGFKVSRGKITYLQMFLENILPLPPIVFLYPLPFDLLPIFSSLSRKKVTDNLN
ncbi:MAG: hypothetical protein C0612_07385 [Desulfobulbaceae bacterium]|nr:MAG: hypothetical protein C0612_07385 [Desulfobulbaceae bacterium]